MSRQLKELRSLMPWTWDARIDEHPAGKSSLRDFKDVYCWTGDDKGRRSHASPRAAGATPLPRKRPPKADRVSSTSGSPPQSTPCNKQVVRTAVEQAPDTRDSAASSGGHLSVPQATPVTGLRSSGRSGKRQAPVSPPPDLVTPAPHTKLPDEQHGSAISTGERLQLQPCTTAPVCRTAAPDAATLARPADSPVAAAATSSPVRESLEGQQPAGGSPICGIAAVSLPKCSDAQQILQTPSPAKPFEAKLAAVQQAEEPPASTVAAPSPCEHGTSAAPEPLQAQLLPVEQPEPLEDTAADDVEESLAAATLLELPRTKLVRPQSIASAVQRQPMGELDFNSVQGHAAAADEPQPQLLTKQQHKSGLLDAAWAASGIAKRPPQQKRSARRVLPAARDTSPRLLSQFPQRQRLSTLSSAAASPHQTSVSPASVAAAAAAAPALSLRARVPQSAPPSPSAAVPSVSAPPPVLPELPPIAPLVLQPVQLRLAAALPPVPFSNSNAQQQTPAQLNVQLTQSSVMQRDPAVQQADGSGAAMPMQPTSSNLPVKRPGGPLDLAHACKLLRWMDELEGKHSLRH